jgi:hypothetical protein
MVVGRMKSEPTRLYQKEQELPPFWQGMPKLGHFSFVPAFHDSAQTLKDGSGGCWPNDRADHQEKGRVPGKTSIQ